jgi:hypothetical protein
MIFRKAVLSTFLMTLITSLTPQQSFAQENARFTIPLIALGAAALGAGAAIAVSDREGDDGSKGSRGSRGQEGPIGLPGPAGPIGPAGPAGAAFDFARDTGETLGFTLDGGIISLSTGDSVTIIPFATDASGTTIEGTPVIATVTGNFIATIPDFADPIFGSYTVGFQAFLSAGASATFGSVKGVAGASRDGSSTLFAILENGLSLGGEALPEQGQASSTFSYDPANIP